MKPSLAIVALLTLASIAHAQDETDAAVARGLDWLARQQAGDGHWDDGNAGHAIATTAFAGMAFLAHGSTIDQGRYRDNLQRAVDWCLKQKSDAKRYHG